MHILESNSFFVGVQWDRFKQKIPEIASSFADHKKRFNTLINVEPYFNIQRMSDGQYSIKGKYLTNIRTSELMCVQCEAGF
jgi:hypothetical protein